MAFLDLWKKVVQSPTFVPDHFQIPATQVDNGKKVSLPFEAHQHYFLVRVNEMFLSYNRKWFSTYDPIVFATTEFQYGTKKITMPFLISPKMFQSPFKKLPQGMLFKDTTVAGLHPYRGGTFGISILLGRLRKEDYLRKLLGFMEHTAGAFTMGFSSMIGSYTSIARLVLDGMDSLLDNNDIDPIIGYRQEYVPLLEDNLTTGYYVLFNAQADQIDKEKLFVRQNSLHYGDTLESAVPFRSDDFVLYSIMSATSRDDTEMLPYHSQFVDLQKLVSAMNVISNDEKKLISGKLFSLQDAVRMSPDLVRSQAMNQIQQYRTEISSMIDSRQPLSGALSNKAGGTDEWEQKMDAQALEILNMTA